MTFKWMVHFRIYMDFKLYFNWSVFILHDREFHKNMSMQVYKVSQAYYLPVLFGFPIFSFPLPFVPFIPLDRCHINIHSFMYQYKL